MTLPDRTLCWVQGPPWDRSCEPVGSLLPAEDVRLDVSQLRERLSRLSNYELGQVVGLTMRVLEDNHVSMESFISSLAAGGWRDLG